MLPRLVRTLRRVADALEGPPVPYATEARWTTPQTPDVSLFVRQLPIRGPGEVYEASGVIEGRWRAAHRARTPKERRQDAEAPTETLWTIPWPPR